MLPIVRVPYVLCITGLCVISLQAGTEAGHRQPGVLSVEAGRTEFEDRCAACHQFEGRVREAPPLAGSAWVTGPESRLIRIVLHGVRGEMEVAGRTYNREMPGFGPVLSDEEVAAVLTFVRKRFGGLTTPIRPPTVTAIRAAHEGRASYWTVDELLDIP